MHTVTPHYLLVDATASTNSYLASHADTLPGDTVVYTHCQTAGRGQPGNSWEAEPGKNLTFSLLLKNPEVAPRDQFLLSEAVSMAIAEVLDKHGIHAMVKWPNDVYCGDGKLCGILIEHSLVGATISHTIVGVGLNVNQRNWTSDAPNPVSMSQLTGNDYDLETLLHQLCEAIVVRCRLGDDAQRHALHQSYLQRLYRHDGEMHPFALPDGTPLQAKITTVQPDGMLVLQHAGGAQHRYAFKQVKHLINKHAL